MEPSYTAPPPAMQQTLVMQQAIAPQAELQVSPFLRAPSPCGLPWYQYVASSDVEVDPCTGLLMGPWAECLCSAVRFEHSQPWQSMPEYACGGGPAGGVLVALESALGGPYTAYAQERLQAAARLEEAMHHAADMGQPMPLIDGPSAHCMVAAAPVVVQAWQPGACEPQGYGYDQPAFGGPPCGLYGYAQEPQQYAYAHEAHATGGPTLLGSQQQNQGMSTGGKVALAAAGGVVAGVAGYALATHMDDVGDAIGGVVEGAGHVAGEAFEGVGHFAGEAFEGVGDLVDDIF